MTLVSTASPGPYVEKTLGGKGGSRETSEEPQAMVEVTGGGDLD